MLLNSNRISRLEFGEFVVDRARRKLLRAGQPVALPPKAFDLLVFMVENPGRPLTKEALLRSVWPDAIVEESNLTQNVFLLRKALGPHGQEVIATLAGRGYQFTSDVVELAVPEATAPPPVSAFQSIEATSSYLVYEEDTEERIAIWQSPLALIFIAASLVLLGVAGWLGWQRYEDHAGGPPVQVVVAGFQGGTGDTALDQALNTALRAGLSQSPYVTLVPNATVRQTLGMMTLKPDAELTASVARDVCERTGSQAVLRGTVAQTGQQFLLTAEAVGCADGATIATFSQVAQDREGLPRAVDKLAASLRHGLGESRRTIARFSQPLFAAQGRTNSMEALEAYSQATVQSQSGHFPEAMELLNHAVALDPDFAVGWLDLSSYAANANNRATMMEYLKKAYAVRSQGTAPVRYLIEARYASEVQGDLFGAEQSYKAMLALYPRNATALSALGETQRQIGHHADAANTLSRALVLAPNYAALYYGVCMEKTKAGLLDEAKQACDSGIAHGLDSEIIRLGLMKLAMAKHDPQLYAQQVAWADQHHSPLLFATEAQADLLEGRLHDAMMHVTQSCAFLGPKQDAVCSQYYFGIAAEMAQIGEMDRARQFIGNRTPDPADSNGLMALAVLGDQKDAEAGLKAHELAHPDSPSWEAEVGALVRADILLQQHRPAEALTALELARPFEGAGLDSWYLRALAFEQNNQPDKAVTEFQRLLKAENIDPANVDIPLAQLGLARALAAANRTSEAHQAYGDFLSIWSHSDADLVLSGKAHAEMAALDTPGK